MIRPLVLILKQFLLDRGLLTAFTGGISSYCLFLMVTRYLQEQSAYSIDPGALLLGFLDFFGNHFDPRATGISVRRREYFSRQTYDEVAITQQQFVARHPIPNMQPLQSVAEKSNNLFHSNNNARGGNSSTKPPRIQNRHSNSKFLLSSQTSTSSSSSAQSQNYVQSGRPYTFDPLFVEDPLSVGNNVGRNAFRIFQVKVNV